MIIIFSCILVRCLPSVFNVTTPSYHLKLWAWLFQSSLFNNWKFTVWYQTFTQTLCTAVFIMLRVLVTNFFGMGNKWLSIPIGMECHSYRHPPPHAEYGWGMVEQIGYLPKSLHYSMEYSICFIFFSNANGVSTGPSCQSVSTFPITAKINFFQIWQKFQSHVL